MFLILSQSDGGNKVQIIKTWTVTLFKIEPSDRRPSVQCARELFLFLLPASQTREGDKRWHKLGGGSEPFHEVFTQSGSLKE